MQIYQALKRDHQEVRELLAQLIQMNEDTAAEERRDLVEEIRDALIPHSRAEESVFYNSLREIAAAQDVVGHAYQEHMEAETLLRALQVQDKIDAGWLKTARKLKEALEHHIAEEEGRTFTVAQHVFTPEEADMMGEAFENLKPEIKEEGLMATTTELIANMMPPRLAKVFRKYNLESRLGAR